MRKSKFTELTGCNNCGEKINKGRMQELRKEVGVKESLNRKLVRSWLKWIAHID